MLAGHTVLERKLCPLCKQFTLGALSGVWCGLGEKRLEGRLLAKLYLVSSEMFGIFGFVLEAAKANEGRIGGGVGVWGAFHGRCGGPGR